MLTKININSITLINDSISQKNLQHKVDKGLPGDCSKVVVDAHIRADKGGLAQRQRYDVTSTW